MKKWLSAIPDLDFFFPFFKSGFCVEQPKRLRASIFRGTQGRIDIEKKSDRANEKDLEEIRAHLHT